MGSLGHRVDFAPAHDLAFGFNAVAGLGTMGAVFHARCSPETTKTFGFLIRMLPTWPAGDALQQVLTLGIALSVAGGGLRSAVLVVRCIEHILWRQ